MSNIGSVPSISNGGSTTFADRDNPSAVRWARALRTVASLSDGSSLDIGVFLVLSNSRSRSISALAIASSAWGVKTLIISSSEAFVGPIAALPTAVFRGMVVGVLGNSG